MERDRAELANWTDIPTALLLLDRPDLHGWIQMELREGSSETAQKLQRYRDTVGALIMLSQMGMSHQPIVLPVEIYHEPIDIPHLQGLGVSVPGAGELRPPVEEFRATAQGMVRLYDNHQAHLATVVAQSPS